MKVLVFTGNVIETRVLLFEGTQRVSPFYHPSIHQIATREKTKLYQRPFLSGLLRAFNESVVVAVLVTCVTANNGFHRSIIFLS